MGGGGGRGGLRLVGEALWSLGDDSRDDLAGAGGVGAPVHRIGGAGQHPREFAENHQRVRLGALARKHLVGVHLRQEPNSCPEFMKGLFT